MVGKESKRLLKIVAVAFKLFEAVQSNWDEATGYLHDYRPSDSWLSQNKAKVCSSDIQVAECSHNTRLHYPDVQLLAVFKVDHSKDKNHGCPYGTCCAYTQLPLVTDMVSDPGNSHSFFRYNLAGFPGIGTNPIADPQTGEYGYESSLDGKFHVGAIDTSTRQPEHDKNYPGFHLPPAWSKPMPFPSQPNTQPSCSMKGQPNLDPGQDGGKGKSGSGSSSGSSSSSSSSNSSSSTTTHHSKKGGHKNRGSQDDDDKDRLKSVESVADGQPFI